MRFLVDMGISPDTAVHLRQLGHDASHLSELHLERLADHEIIEKARLENRVLLAHDLDFGEIMAASNLRLPSVVIFRLHSMHPDNVRRHLNTVIADHEKSLTQGAIISVMEGRIRIRQLPIQ
jgi:predicted nuclease of predicted toxin-antitoxin system